MNPASAQGGGTNLLSGLSPQVLQQLATLTGLIGGHSGLTQAQQLAVLAQGSLIGGGGSGIGITNGINSATTVPSLTVTSSQGNNQLVNLDSNARSVDAVWRAYTVERTSQPNGERVIQQKSGAICGSYDKYDEKTNLTTPTQVTNLPAPVPNSTIQSMPWPVVAPMLQVPYFDIPSYRTVNLDVQPSHEVTGLDLPLNDVTTLRFFFNLGVQQCRSLAANQMYQERVAHGGGMNLPTQTALHTNNIQAAQLAGLNITSSSSCSSDSQQHCYTCYFLLHLCFSTNSFECLSLEISAQAQTEKSNLHEMRMQMLNAQQHNNLALNPYLRPIQEVVKPVAVGGGSGDAALSPRPPIPVDPSPPRTVVDAATNVADVSNLIHQQVRNQAFLLPAQTSPPTLLETPRPTHVDQVRRETVAAIGTNRPHSAREFMAPSTSQGNLKGGPQSSAPATPAYSTDDFMPMSQTLFQVSEQNFTEAFNSTSIKKNPTTPIGIARNEDGKGKVDVNGPSNGTSSSVEHKEEEEKPAVDYSSRPIDPIFQQARARLEHVREYKEVSPKPAIQSQRPHNIGDDGAATSGSPIGVALSTVAAMTTTHSTQGQTQSINPLGINRIVPDAIAPTTGDEQREDSDEDSPAEKRLRIATDEE
uniref:PUM-HD domain-containing protein n=1 Tax=Heterorhabditis bacteriophora TaxID=37862 RepID=A0A1I7XFA8_HETBA